jgi:PAS domain S-box-containing protein
MRDEDKTREQLLEELRALREHVAPPAKDLHAREEASRPVVEKTTKGLPANGARQLATVPLPAIPEGNGEEESRRQKEILQTIFDHIPVMIAFLDAKGRVQLVNRHWEKVVGWSLEEARNLDLLAECYPDPDYRQQVLAYIRNPPQGWSDFKTRVRDGRTLDTSWANILLSDGTSLGFGKDITERKQADQALEQYTARMQALSRRLVQVQEEERRHLARELHDGICQILTSVAFAFEAGAAAPPEMTAAKMSDARTLLEEALTRVRELSFDLRPALLDHLGLLPALRCLIERYTARTGVRVNFKHAGLEERVAPEVETAAYRIVQEALSNVARHAQVPEAVVRSWVEADTLAVQVEDQGVGFDADAIIAAAGSNGLPGMRERVLLLEGRLIVESTPGSGSHVLAELPLRGHSRRKSDEHCHRPGR